MKRLALPIFVLSLGFTPSLSANPYKLQYGGRLVSSWGQPLSGPLSLTVNFYNAAGGSALLATQSFTSVTLQEGLFNLTIELSPASFETVFASSEVWIEIIDNTNGKTYPRQKFGAVPFAFKVPTDALTLGYDANGKMRVQGLGPAALPSGNPSDGQILKWKDGTGWEWGADNTGGASGSVDSAAIVDASISNVDIAANAAIAGIKISPNFGAQNITTTGIISGDGSGLTNLSAGPLGTSIDGSEIANGSITDTHISASAAIDPSKVSGLVAALAAKEGTITTGTSAQYLKGDKSWATLDTAAVPENVNLYYTDTRARASLSASAPLSYNNATGQFTITAASAVSAGTISAAEFLSFSAKQAAITASSTVNAGTLTTALQNAVAIGPFGTNAGENGELRFLEQSGSGSNYVGFKAPDTIAADKVYVLPAADGSVGQFLSTDGSGNLTWGSVGGAAGGTVTSITAGTGLTGGTITGSGTFNLANTAVTPGSYTRSSITVDAQGRLTAAANGSAVDLTSEVSGALPLANGGTGATTAPLARAAMSAASAGANTDITSLGGLTTALTLGQGGTGATTAPLARTSLGAAASGANSDITSLTGLTTALSLPQGGTGATTAPLARTSLGLGSLSTLNAVGSSEITDASIADADISGSAAISQSKIADLTTDLSTLSSGIAGKEATITAGTTAQYWRGDKSWQTLSSSAVPEGTNLYFTDARARDAVSASAPLSYNSGTGAFSIPAATSVANGYLSSGDWLSFSAKQVAITAASAIDTGSLSTALQAGIELKPFGVAAGNSGELRFDELAANGSNYVGFKAPDDIAANRVWVLPAADGSNGQCLITNGSGVLSWSPSAVGTVTGITAGTGLSGGTINSSGTIALADTAVSAGSYTRATITVDAQGRLTAAANGASVNLGSEVTSTLPVANGGTGVTTSTGTGNVVLSTSPTLITPALGTPSSGVATNLTGLPLSTGITGTLAVANGGTGVTTSTGTGNLVLSNSPTLVTPALGTPASGVATNLTGLPLSTGVTGTLPVANGGTGASTLTLNNVLLGNGTSAPLLVAPGGSGNVLTSNGTTWESTAIPATTWATPGTIGSTTPNTGSFTSLSATSLSVAGATSIFGVGEGGTPTATTIRGAAGAGSNIAGADLTIRPSNGTGTGGSGAINFQTAPAAASSSTANTMATRMTIDKAGNVGIGNTSPTRLFEVSSSHTNDTTIAIQNTSTGGRKWALGSLGLASVSAGAFEIYDSTIDVSRLLIDSSGKVGIGTTSPSVKLDVGGSTSIKASPTSVLTGSIDPITGLTVPGVGTSFTSELAIGDRITVSGVTRAVTAIASDTSLTVGSTLGNLANDTAPDRLPAALTVKDSSNNVQFVVNDSGDVGIGTVDPRAKIAAQVSVGPTYPSSSPRLASQLAIESTIDSPSAAGSLAGQDILVEHYGTANFGSLYGSYTWVWANGGSGTSIRGAMIETENDVGNLTTHTGLDINVMEFGGTVTDLAGLEMTVYANGAATTNLYGIWINELDQNSGTAVTNRYGLRLDDFAGTATNDFGIYQAGSSQKNYFAGSVGIGTTNPQSTFEIITSAASNRQLMINSLELGYDSAGYGRLQAWQSSAKPIIMNPAGGNVGIGNGITAPSHILQINGQGRATNSAWATTSDMRLKDVLGSFENFGLEEIKQIDTIRFRYKKDNPLNLSSLEEHIGVSAQQLQKIIPDAVEMQDDGYLTVNTDPVFWSLINAVKELSAQNDQLNAGNEKLKIENLKINSKLDFLMKAFCKKEQNAEVCR